MYKTYVTLLALLGTLFILAGCPAVDDDDSSGDDDAADDDAADDDAADDDAADDDAADDDTGGGDVMLGSCEYGIMCAEYYAAAEDADTVLETAPTQCAASAGTWQEATLCSHDSVLAKCTMPYGGEIDAYNVTFCYEEAAVTAMEMMCTGDGAVWEEY